MCLGVLHKTALSLFSQEDAKNMAIFLKNLTATNQVFHLPTPKAVEIAGRDGHETGGGPLDAVKKSMDNDTKDSGHMEMQRNKAVGIFKAVHKSQPNVKREEAARQLEGLECDAVRPYIQQIADMLEDPIPLVRWRAVHKLGQLGGDSMPHALGIAKCIDDVSWEVRCRAIYALSQISRKILKKYVQVFVAALGDHHWLVRDAAAQALQSFKDVDVAPYMDAIVRVAFYDADSKIRDSLLHVIRKVLLRFSRVGDEVRVVDNVIVDMLKSNDPQLRLRICRVFKIFRALGSKYQKHVANLIHDNGQNPPEIRIAATRALGYMGPRAGPSVHVLLPLLSEQSSDMRQLSVEALGLTGDSAAEHAPKLAVMVISDPDVDVRRAAAEALGHMWTAAEEHVNALATAMADEDAKVRKAAEKAMFLMGEVATRQLIERILATPPGSETRFNAMRGLSVVHSLPIDTKAAFVCEWAESPMLPIPLPGLMRLPLPEPEHALAFPFEILCGTPHGEQKGQYYVIFKHGNGCFDWVQEFSDGVALNKNEDQKTFLVTAAWRQMSGSVIAVKNALKGCDIDELFITGSSKGGMVAAGMGLILRSRLVLGDRFELFCRQFSVITFGAPNFASKGADPRLFQLGRQALLDCRRAGRYRAWIFPEDPVPAILSPRSRDVVNFYRHSSGFIVSSEGLSAINSLVSFWDRHLLSDFEGVLPYGILDAELAFRTTRVKYRNRKLSPEAEMGHEPLFDGRIPGGKLAFDEALNQMSAYTGALLNSLLMPNLGQYVFDQIERKDRAPLLLAWDIWVRYAGRKKPNAQGDLLLADSSSEESDDDVPRPALEDDDDESGSSEDDDRASGSSLKKQTLADI